MIVAVVVAGCNMFSSLLNYHDVELYYYFYILLLRCSFLKTIQILHCLVSMCRPISQAHVAQHYVNDDSLSQWRRPKFDPHRIETS